MSMACADVRRALKLMRVEREKAIVMAEEIKNVYT